MRVPYDAETVFRRGRLLGVGGLVAAYVAMFAGWPMRVELVASAISGWGIVMIDLARDRRPWFWLPFAVAVTALAIVNPI